MDVRRVKRQASIADDIGSDLFDQAHNMINNMGDTGGADVDKAANSAKNMLDQAQSLAGQIWNSTGIDPPNMPSDLAEMARNLFQMSQTPSFQNMLQSFLASTNGDASAAVEKVKSNFEKLLKDADFVRDSQSLLEDYGNGADDPGFQTALQSMVLERLLNMGNGAKGLAAPLAPLLVVLVVQVLL